MTDMQHTQAVLDYVAKNGGAEELLGLLMAKPRQQCGECQLCCRLLPVAEISKIANRTCEHQCSTGCSIYEGRPNSCRMWSCLWVLARGGTATMPRPDEVHYVIDPLPDLVTIGDADNATPMLVLQVWVDPYWPKAHEDPALRNLLEKRKQPALIRYGDKEGFVLVPPSLNPRGTWLTIGSNMRDPSDAQNDAQDSESSAKLPSQP